jgi:hypothetical protein
MGGGVSLNVGRTPDAQSLVTWLTSTPIAPTWVDIYKYFPGAGTTQLIYKGTVDTVNIDEHNMQFSLQSLANRLVGDTPLPLIEQLCTTYLYSDRCGVSNTAWTVNGTLDSVSSDGLTLTSSGFDAQVGGGAWYVDGEDWADDSHEFKASGACTPNNASFVTIGEAYRTGFRFYSEVPQGVTISQAFMRFTRSPTYGMTLTAYCQDADTTLAFTNTNYDITNRTLTSASTVTRVEDFDGSNLRPWVDVAAPLQEVVSRGAYGPGNYVVVLTDNVIVDGAFTLFYVYPMDQSAQAVPALSVTWATPGVTYAHHPWVYGFIKILDEYRQVVGTPTSDQVVISIPFPENYAVAGQTYDIYGGCDLTSGICANRFLNLVNFRGFPYVPLEDTPFKGPQVNLPSTTVSGGKW